MTAQATRICGAETKKCRHCGHHQREHDWVDAKSVGKPYRKNQSQRIRRGPCKAAGCAGCSGFEGTPHQQTIGLFPNGRCKLHGGMTPRGMALPHYKGYADVLPRKFAADYERQLNDPEMLSLRKEIAITRTYLRDAAARVRDGRFTGPAAMKATRHVCNAWTQMVLALDGHGDQTRARIRLQEAVEELRESMTAARQDMESRIEFARMEETLEKLTRSENTRIAVLYSMISSQQAFQLRKIETNVFLQALEEQVEDRELRLRIRKAVAAGFADLAGRRDLPALVAGGDGGEDSVVDSAADD